MTRDISDHPDELPPFRHIFIVEPVPSHFGSRHINSIDRDSNAFGGPLVWDQVSLNLCGHLKFVGNAAGPKTAGAILMKSITDLDLNCQVTNLPDVIEVDISNLDVGQAIHAGEITLPKSTMKLLTDPDAVVVQIVVQAAADEDGEGAEVSGDGASPEVIGEKKDDEAKDGE